MSSSRHPTLGVLLICGLAVLTAIGLYQTCDRGVAHVAWARRPTGIMGTESLLVAVVPHGHKPRAEAALDAAEQALRSVETRMSTWLED